jgi:methyltransferase
MTRWLICAYAISLRLLELRASHHHVATYEKAKEGPWSRRTFPLMVLLHASVLTATLLFGKRPRWPWLAIFLALQPVRFWVLQTLGDRWNARGVVPETMAIATDGPYAWVRHPNYTVVAGELFSLPAAFGLTRLALGAAALNACLIAARVRDEEQRLWQLPGYRDHFEKKWRFVPFVF